MAETDSELAALEFFRRAAYDDDIDTPVTVTKLEDLLYNADREIEATSSQNCVKPSGRRGRFRRVTPSSS
ncbi:hypothetical protein ACFQO4_09455 [Saliphagus sp. GCM10025334]